MAKSPNAFRTISEVAEAVGTPQHVLRFWETKFPFVAPVKRAGGRRFYRPQDVVVLKAVRRLLHEEGLTIRGVQRLHKEQGLARLAAYGDPEAEFQMDARERPGEIVQTGESPERRAGSDHALLSLLHDIERARVRLDAALAG